MSATPLTDDEVRAIYRQWLDRPGADELDLIRMTERAVRAKPLPAGLTSSQTITLDSIETSEADARTPGALWLDLPAERFMPAQLEQTRLGALTRSPPLTRADSAATVAATTRPRAAAQVVRASSPAKSPTARFPTTSSRTLTASSMALL